MPDAQINYLAVAVAAAVTFLIGALWYSPALFGNLWLKANDVGPDKMERMKARAGRAYGVSFLAYLVMAAVMSVLVSWTGSHSLAAGLRLGAVVWLGFAATIGLTANMYSEKPISAYVIDAGYQLVYLLVQGAILAVWR